MDIGERFRGQLCAFLPRNIYNDIDEFIMKYYDYFYKMFVTFWSSHSTFHPCKLKSDTGNDNLCSAAIICDGHMKIRRRLCANGNVPLILAEHFSPLFSELKVGCSHTPRINSKFCISCSSNELIIEDKQQLTINQNENGKRKLNDFSKHSNDMERVSFIPELACSRQFFWKVLKWR